MTANRPKSGQAMIETTIAMIVVLIVFLAMFNLSDQMRAKLLVENASVKCARARAVGYNDFMLRKIARLSTMPAAGRCLTASAHDGDAALSRGERYARIGDYLASEYEAQADAILDFEHWQDGNTSVACSADASRTIATVTQRRPRITGLNMLTGSANSDTHEHAPISATGTAEAHYKSYLQ